MAGKALGRSEGDEHLPWGVQAAQGMTVWVDRGAAQGLEAGKALEVW